MHITETNLAETEFTSGGRSSGAYRVLEIVLGVIAIAAAITTLFFPAAVVVTLVVFFGIALLVVGILRVATVSGHLEPAARTANAVTGVLAIVVGILILIFPGVSTVTLAFLLGFGVLIWGIGRIVVGSTETEFRGGMRALLIVLGVLLVVFASIIFAEPLIAIYTYAFFVSLAFFVIGIDSLASGAAGVPLMHYHHVVTSQGATVPGTQH